METWEKIVIAILVGGLMFLFIPATSRALKNSPKGSASDWLSAAKPIGLVVAFVVILIIIARN
ncbi:MAG: hypothetical protein MJA28_07320 [Gammaproteobacteria bacterium]|nr:hypothetical protein [Gammaproteobacteria bacterium]